MAEHQTVVKAAPEPAAAPGQHAEAAPFGVGAGPALVLAAQRAAGNAAVSRALAVQREGLPVVGTLLGGIIAMIRSVFTDRVDFLQAAHQARHRPIFGAEWDAWGHAVCGAGAAMAGTEGEAWLLGTMREDFQDAFLGQDSSSQDRHNQAVGRSLAGDGVRTLGPSIDDGGILNRCTTAYLQGRLRIGPDRRGVFLPWMAARSGASIFEEVQRHEGSLWVPREGHFVNNPSAWAEAVEPGPNGTAVGPGRTPRTPMPDEVDPEPGPFAGESTHGTGRLL